MSTPALRPPAFDEQVAIDNYKAASKEALAAATSFADKVVTASFSFATAYGAVIALVTPDETPQPLVAVLPFVCFAGGVVFALRAQAIGIETQTTVEVAELKAKVAKVIKAKRFWGQIALISLTIGIILAGVIVRGNYAESADAETATEVTLLLTPAGSRYVSRACGSDPPPQLAGSVEEGADLSAARIDIAVDDAACEAGAGTLSLPQRAIAVVRS